MAFVIPTSSSPMGTSSTHRSEGEVEVCQNSRLLLLPGELRNQIYRLVIDEISQYLPRVDGHLTLLYYPCSWGNGLLDLAHVCRQLRREYLSYWTKNLKFYFHVRDFSPFVRTFFPNLQSNTESHDYSQCRGNLTLRLPLVGHRNRETNNQQVIDLTAYLKANAACPNVNCAFDIFYEYYDPREPRPQNESASFDNILNKQYADTWRYCLQHHFSQVLLRWAHSFASWGGRRVTEEFVLVLKSDAKIGIDSADPLARVGLSGLREILGLNPEHRWKIVLEWETKPKEYPEWDYIN